MTATSFRYSQIASTAVQEKKTSKKYCSKAATTPQRGSISVVRPPARKVM